MEKKGVSSTSLAEGEHRAEEPTDVKRDDVGKDFIEKNFFAEKSAYSITCKILRNLECHQVIPCHTSLEKLNEHIEMSKNVSSSICLTELSEKPWLRFNKSFIVDSLEREPELASLLINHCNLLYFMEEFMCTDKNQNALTKFLVKSKCTRCTEKPSPSQCWHRQNFWESNARAVASVIGKTWSVVSIVQFFHKLLNWNMEMSYIGGLVVSYLQEMGRTDEAKEIYTLVKWNISMFLHTAMMEKNPRSRNEHSICDILKTCRISIITEMYPLRDIVQMCNTKEARALLSNEDFDCKREECKEAVSILEYLMESEKKEKDAQKPSDDLEEKIRTCDLISLRKILGSCAKWGLPVLSAGDTRMLALRMKGIYHDIATTCSDQKHFNILFRDFSCRRQLFSAIYSDKIGNLSLDNLESCVKSGLGYKSGCTSCVEYALVLLEKRPGAISSMYLDSASLDEKKILVDLHAIRCGETPRFSDSRRDKAKLGNLAVLRSPKNDLAGRIIFKMFPVGVAEKYLKEVGIKAALEECFQSLLVTSRIDEKNCFRDNRMFHFLANWMVSACSRKEVLEDCSSMGNAWTFPDENRTECCYCSRGKLEMYLTGKYRSKKAFLVNILRKKRKSLVYPF